MMHRGRGVTRDRDKKAKSDLNYVWTSNDTHQPSSALPDLENRKMSKL